MLFQLKPNPCPGPECWSNLNGLIQPSPSQAQYDQTVIWSDNATYCNWLFGQLICWPDLLAWCLMLRPSWLDEKSDGGKDFLFGNGLTLGALEKKKLRPLLFPTFFFVWSIFSDRWTIHVTSLWEPHIPRSLEGYCIDRVATRHLISNNRLPEGMFSYLRREMNLSSTKCFNLQLPKKVRACS